MSSKYSTAICLTLLIGGVLLSGCGKATETTTTTTTQRETQIISSTSGGIVGKISLNGANPETTTAKLVRVSNGITFISGAYTINPDGSFEMSNMPAGTWDIGIQITKSGKKYCIIKTGITIPEGATANIGNLGLVEMAHISGKIAYNTELTQVNMTYRLQEDTLTTQSDIYSKMSERKSLTEASDSVANNPKTNFILEVPAQALLSLKVTPSGKLNSSSFLFKDITVNPINVNPGATTNIGIISAERL